MAKLARASRSLSLSACFSSSSGSRAKWLRGSKNTYYRTAIKVTTFQLDSLSLFLPLPISSAFGSSRIICLKIVRSPLRPLIKQKLLTLYVSRPCFASTRLASLIANLKAARSALAPIYGKLFMFAKRLRRQSQ